MFPKDPNNPLHHIDPALQEAVRRAGETRRALSIFHGAPPINLQEQLTSARPAVWRTLVQVESDEKAARIKAKRDGQKLVATPEPVFDEEL